MKKKFFCILCLVAFFLFADNASATYSAVVDVTQMDIFEIQQAIDDGYLTYEGLMKIYLERIGEYNDEYDAIISINEKAIEEARECDMKYRESGRSSIVFGMPVIVKDNIDVIGFPTTSGTTALLDSYPKNDATVITNLKNAGAIVLAKANMSEFAFFASSSTSMYGTVKNAYDTSYSSYGSSGGSSVAVALAFAPIAIGTDTNMSIRVPAAANNVFGIRPTFGTVSNDGILLYDITRDVAGAITKTASENAAVTAIMQGYDYDYYLSDNSVLQGKTIAVIDDFVSGDNDVLNLFNQAIFQLEKQGAIIIHLSDFMKGEYLNVSSNTIGGWTMCYNFNNYIKNTSSAIRSFKDLANSEEKLNSIWDYYDDCSISISVIDTYDERKSGYLSYVTTMFEENDIDAIVYPTTTNKLLKLDEHELVSNADLIAPVLGLPDIEIPIGNIDGLYYGMDLIALRGEEKKLYEIAIAYDSHNDTYVLPVAVPNLYNISDEVLYLKDTYEKYRNDFTYFNGDNLEKANYYAISDDIKTFLLEYDSYSDKDEVAKELLSKYLTSIDKINNYKKVLLKKIIIVFSVIIILIIIMILISRKLKKEKKKI